MLPIEVIFVMFFFLYILVFVYSIEQRMTGKQYILAFFLGGGGGLFFFTAECIEVRGNNNLTGSCTPFMYCSKTLAEIVAILE